MTTKFGQSHRAVVQDVNEGIVAKAQRAPESQVGLRAIRGKRNDVNIIEPDRQHGGAELAAALMGAVGSAAKAHNREWKRRQILEGTKKAGTAVGRAEIDKVSSVWYNKVFGPGASLRASQERIVKDTTDAGYLKLQSDLEDFGHKMPAEEWEEHVLAASDEMTDKYQDEGIKDQITERFGQNSTALYRDYEKSNKQFLQMEARKTFINSMFSGTKMAQADLDSGDPHRVGDAATRLRETLVRPEGMTEEAHLTAVADVLKQQLANGKDGLWNVAGELIAAMPFEERTRLENVKELYDTQFVRDAVEMDLQVEASAEAGDVAGTVALVEATYKKFPALYPNGPNEMIGKAMEREAEIMEEKRLATVRMTKAINLDSTLKWDTPEDQAVAVEGAINHVADTAIRAQTIAGLNRAGEEIPEEINITPEERGAWKMEHPDKWERIWSQNNIVVPSMQNMQRHVMALIGTPDMNRETTGKLKNAMDTMTSVRAKNPALFAKHFDSVEAMDTFMMYQQMMNVEGADPHNVVQQLRQVSDMRARGLVFEPTTAEMERGPADVAKQFKTEKAGFDWTKTLSGAVGFVTGGPQGFKAETREDLYMEEILLAESARVYKEAFSVTNNHEAAVVAATARLQRGSAVVGANFILDGARLDENSYGKSFHKVVQGINENETSRQQLIDKDNYDLPEDFDLMKEGTHFLSGPDQTSVTIRYTDDDNKTYFIPLKLPTTPEGLLETDSDRRARETDEALRKISRDTMKLYDRPRYPGPPRN